MAFLEEPFEIKKSERSNTPEQAGDGSPARLDASSEPPLPPFDE
jgi:hypothetical protein